MVSLGKTSVMLRGEEKSWESRLIIIAKTIIILRY